MTKINPYIIVIVGLIIGGFSAYLVYFNELKKFFSFILIGIVMIFYGLIMSFITGSNKKNKNKNQENNHPLSKWLSNCPYCKSQIPNNSIFCSYCGRRLK